MVLALCAIESQDLLPVRVPVKLTFADMEPEVMKFNPRATIMDAVRVYEQRWETSPTKSVQLMWVEGKRYLTSHETWATICRRGIPTIEGMVFSRHPYKVCIEDKGTQFEIEVRSDCTIREVINRAGVVNRQARLCDCGDPTIHCGGARPIRAA